MHRILTRRAGSPGSHAIVLAFSLRLTADPGANGHHWPRFLGPTGDGKSAEKNRRDRPAGGLEVLVRAGRGGLQRPVGRRRRVFVFDRVGDEARLRTLASDSGEEL